MFLCFRINWYVVAVAVDAENVADSVRRDLEAREVRRGDVCVNAVDSTEFACCRSLRGSSRKVRLEDFGEVAEVVFEVIGYVTGLFEVFAGGGVVAPVIVVDKVEVSGEDDSGEFVVVDEGLDVVEEIILLVVGEVGLEMEVDDEEVTLSILDV